jgi:hypothetical protein
MGLHRDGGKWNLPDEVVEDRRRVFWECRSAEVFQVRITETIDGNLLTLRPIASLDREPLLMKDANQSRSSIAPEFVDTAFPQTATVFYNLKFELCKISDA